MYEVRARPGLVLFRGPSVDGMKLWLALDPEEARELAATLLTAAGEANLLEKDDASES